MLRVAGAGGRSTADVAVTSFRPKAAQNIPAPNALGPPGGSWSSISLPHAAKGHAGHHQCVTVLSPSVCWLGSVQAQGARDAASGILGQLDTLQGTLDTISRDLPGAIPARPTYPNPESYPSPSRFPSCCQRPH